jgi:hypothetical protein
MSEIAWFRKLMYTSYLSSRMLSRVDGGSTMNRACFALIVSAFCLALPAFASGVPCNSASGPPGWRVYVDEGHRFCFQYPPIYKISRDGLRRHSMVLELRAEGDILVWFDQRPFSPSRFEELSRSGNPAEPTKIGGLTFYYNGPEREGLTTPTISFSTCVAKSSTSSSTAHISTTIVLPRRLRS